MTSGEELVEGVLRRYLGSHGFNGLSVAQIKDTPTNRALLADLIGRRSLDLVRGDNHSNPHIKAFPSDKAAGQLQKLAEQGIGHGCLYPTEELLAEREAGRPYADRPFSKELAEGGAQLEHRIFDLRVLEFYRNDPRFEYRVDDVMGSIYRRAEHREDSLSTVSDGIELARFGFAYDDNMNRGVALFLRDLDGLEAEQQQYMKGYLVNGSYKLHPGFYQSAVLGQWPDRISIYDAVMEEKKHINAMCAVMTKPPLFKTDAESRPHGYGILLRPTNKEFRDFVLLLNQMLSDDLNPKFFEGDIPTSETMTKSDGTQHRTPIGTIKLLQNWLDKFFTPADLDGVADVFRKLRNLRDLRAKPAHVTEDNAFDQRFVHEQRELIQDAYFIVRMIRMAFENHPSVRGYEVPSYLREARVWTM